MNLLLVVGIIYALAIETYVAAAALVGLLLLNI